MLTGLAPDGKIFTGKDRFVDGNHYFRKELIEEGLMLEILRQDEEGKILGWTYCLTQRGAVQGSQALEFSNATA
jgi:hypothetical protein